MRRYETIFIVRPNVSDDEIEAVTNKATSIIEDEDGTIIRIDNWGLKKLAYLIKKETQGYYVYIDYTGVPAAVAEIERIFRIDDRILKYLTVKLADFCDPEAAKKEMEEAAAKAEAEAEATRTPATETSQAPAKEEKAEDAPAKEEKAEDAPAKEDDAATDEQEG